MSAHVDAAVALAHRREWAQLLAVLARTTGDLELAEECVQEAFAQALVVWPVSGIPDRPGAWLTRVARNRALDELRRRAALRRRLPLLVTDGPVSGPDSALDDDRLRLIFTCCHPALSQEAQAALTLRLVCGLSTGEVARAFLVSEATMAARLTRAKKKIATARIPYRTPAPESLGARVSVVLEVVQLIFTTGHTAPAGPGLVRHDLLDRALDLGRLLHLLMPTSAEVAAQLALMLLTSARAAARVSSDGRLLLLSEQDRSLWNPSRIAQGVALLDEALRRGPASRYALQAAIAATHASAASWEATDWAEIVELYSRLFVLWPSPVVALNRAVAVGMRDGPAAGLAALSPLLSEPALATYPYLSAARADFLRQLGRVSEAASAYEEALVLTSNDVERRFLLERLGAL
ncbi:RNA polymerase sigma-70 factor, ECF subfamily [Asanoa hainanensis]|uniref:RNA polymerase sigma-70 factor, ECF subfamily n=1 Tax=Asanoa hainanensis TaxID=560556 RepID=A0A239NXR9_9ACTN|nr:sigma-70 family RNA polymerase sigma factor [Asanoa hainanensis]SNT59625.1 RNA polymerase sigma-70 factor, ECF subfamily [Asanoa hainanensis]